VGKNGLMSVPLTIEQRKELEDQFKDYSKKYKNGLPIVLQDAFKAISLGISPVDLGLLNSTKEGRIRLCAIYGFPAVLVGDTSASTYNNVVEAKTDAWLNCIKPNLDDLAGDLTSFLIKPVEQFKSQGLFFAWDYSAVQELQKDIAKQVTWMKQSYWTPNEIREATGVNPINDPVMDEVWVGLGEQPISQATVDLINEPPVKNFGDYK
jgi:phage portal protein BeeE